MSAWVAVSYGALDVRGREDFEGLPEILVLPVFPVGSPVGLAGEVAEFWRRFVEAPVSDDDLTDEERELVEEFTAFGIVSSEFEHPARLHEIPEPWLYSPMHELVNSLVISVARDAGVDMLVIKGPALSLQGLREKKHSGDVDVWVEQGKIDQLANCLAAWGWASLPTVWNGTRVQHSLTLNAGSWGCQVDMHHFFPGVGVTAGEAFALLGDDREPIHFAGTAGWVAGRSAHAVISALHTLRPTFKEQPPEALLSVATSTLMKAGVEVISVAQRFGAAAPLDTALRAAFPEVSIPDPGPPPPSWEWRTRSGLWAMLASALGGMPIRERPRYLLRTIWPDEQTLIAAEVINGSGERRPYRMRVNRWRRAIRNLIRYTGTR